MVGKFEMFEHPDRVKKHPEKDESNGWVICVERKHGSHEVHTKFISRFRSILLWNFETFDKDLKFKFVQKTQ